MSRSRGANIALKDKTRVSTVRLHSVADLLLLYPQDSLKEQIKAWSRRHPERVVVDSCERSLPEIRCMLRGAGSAIVDATGDAARAIDAFLQAAACLGPGVAALYSEAGHEELELFVRVRGSLFLMGPLFDDQWDELFDRWLHVEEVLPVALGSRGAWQQPVCRSAAVAGKKQTA